MNGLPYYKAYPRDFIEGTIGMPFEVKCAYRVVLDLIYMQGGNLPDDPRYISGLLGCTIRKWKSIREELVSTGKLEVSGEFLTNYRAVSELETLAKHQEKQAENRSRPNKNKELQSPRFNHTEPDTDTDINSEPNGSGAGAPTAEIISIVPADTRKLLFDETLPLLAKYLGKPAPSLRGLLAKWLRDTGDDALKVNRLILEAIRDKRADPVSWVERCLKPADPDAAIYRGVMY